MCQTSNRRKRMFHKLDNKKFISAEHNNGELIKSTKKKILMAWSIIIVVLITFWCVAYFLEKIENNLNKKPIYNPNAQTIIFHEIDYNENIFQDAVYMGMDRNIYICDINTGITESLEEHDYANYGPDVKFMANFVNFIIEGNAVAYNDCFSDNYYSDINNDPKESFTMQKLYNIKLTKISEEKSDNGDYTEYYYFLEYMIYQNNGSFRMDIESDASVAQYITLIDKDSDYKIDELVRSYYQ